MVLWKMNVEHEECRDQSFEFFFWADELLDWEIWERVHDSVR